MASQWVMMLLRIPHCGITVGNDVANNIHCDVAMCTYHVITVHNDVVMMPTA